MALVGCQKKAGGIDNIGDNKVPTGYQISYTQEVTGQLHNKGMGWNALEEQTELGKLDLGHNGTIPECDVIGIQTSWALIEKTPGNFDWSLVDQTIDYWTGLGKRINFRICTDSLSLPEVYFGAPHWINEAPYNVDYEEYQYSGDMMARVNDLADPTYQRLFENFLDKLAERYVDNPYLDNVDIRGYGMYGEWHSGHSFKTMQERMDTLAYIIDEYQERFAKNNIELFLSCSWDYQGGNKDGSSASTYGNCSYDDYLDMSAFRHAMYLDNVSFRRDGLAGNGCTKYATDEKLMSDYFRSGKKVSFCGEYFSGIANYQSGALGMSPMEATDELLFKSHCNYSTALGWVNSEIINILEGDYAEVFDRGNTKMGFRFKVDRTQYPKVVKQGQVAHVLTSITNSGVGRFNLPNHNIRLMLIDDNGKLAQFYDNKEYDLRILANGELMNVYSDFTINGDVKDGTYTLAIAIVDENGMPDIRFGQVGDYDQKVYPLGKIQIANTKQLSDIHAPFNYVDRNTHKFDAGKHYEVTFDYTPSLDLSEYLLGDDNGFELRLVKGNEKRVMANWQDVSGEKATKTISFSTEDFGGGTLEIAGTGVYEGKIQVGKVRINEQTGYYQQFDEKYDLLSTNSVWFSDNNNASVAEVGINGKSSLALDAITPHKDNECLFSDPALLKLKPNTCYTISFDTKGDMVGGNGAYYYLKLKDGYDDVKVIGEWYDRPDEPQTNKSFTFITGSGNEYQLVFGVKNVGGYFIDNINILENSKGTYIQGKDHPIERNVRPYDEEKMDESYIEGFENGVCNDSRFTYGFNRWGCLTNDKEELIEGDFSFSSRIEPITYTAFKDNNWFEFLYSNSKYVKFEQDTRYKVTFKYKVLEPIMLNTDPETKGYAYMLLRARSGGGDSNSVNFGSTVTVGQVKTMTAYLQTGQGKNYYFLLGIYGRGLMIVDDISIVKA